MSEPQEKSRKDSPSAALQAMRVLDAPGSESYDRVTRLAAELLHVPIVLFALVEHGRQNLRSRVGLAAADKALVATLCSHVLTEREMIVVTDLTRDPRFSNNPMVTSSEAAFRSYLSVPIFSSSGNAVGSLSAIDVHTRTFDPIETRRLKDLAKILEEGVQAQEAAKCGDQLLQIATERESLFRDSFEQVAVGITHIDFTGRLIRTNPRICEMLGASAAELQVISILDITHPDDIETTMACFQQIMTGQIASSRLEKRLKRQDGTFLWTQIAVQLKRFAAGRPDYMIAVIEDIETRKRSESDLLQTCAMLRTQMQEQQTRLQDRDEVLRTQMKKVLESEHDIREASRRFQAIADHVPALLGYWNKDLKCEFANDVYREWFGIDPRAIIGMSMPDVLGEALFDAAEPHVRVALDGHSQRYESTAPGPDGSTIFRDIRYIPDSKATGEVAGFYVMVTDVTQARTTQRALEVANAKLMLDSAFDHLTGLSNRRIFSERSEEALKRFHSHREGYGLVLLDLDNFKQINDGYGHGTGDEVLRVVGRVLKNQLRSHRDIAARLGGEEFAVLCFGDLDEELLGLVAERMRVQICQEKILTGSTSLNFTASFGLAIGISTDTDWRNIYARADAALYEAKAAGKNRVNFGKSTDFSVTSKFRTLRGQLHQI
jgi:diguanylate cyclase (GGDEF)-like protein/PAS domain S-box-containing protein